MFKDKKVNFFNLVLAIIFLSLLVFLFHQQVASPLVQDDSRFTSTGWKPAPGAAYISDFPHHMKLSLEPETRGYSLWGFSIYILGQISDPYYSVPFFLALIVLASVWGTRLLLDYLVPSASGNILWLLAWLNAFAMSLWVPKLPVTSLFAISASIWHNSTYIAMKSLAVFSLYFYFKTNETYLDKINWGYWLLFTLCLTLSTLVKPSFFIAFSPIMAIFLLSDLFKTKGRSFGKGFLFSASVFPSLAGLLYQAYLLFLTNASRDKIAFGFGELQFKSEIDLVLLGHLLSLVFPILVYALLKKYFKGRFEYKVLTLTFLVALFQAWCFYEDGGPRYFHGNFTWGVRAGCFLLFIEASAVLAQWTADLKGNWRQPQVVGGFWLLWGCLIWHSFSGLRYFALLLTGASYGAL